MLARAGVEPYVAVEGEQSTPYLGSGWTKRNFVTATSSGRRILGYKVTVWLPFEHPEDLLFSMRMAPGYMLPGQQVALVINGKYVDSVGLKRRRIIDFDVPAEYIRAGLNRVDRHCQVNRQPGRVRG